MILSLPVIVQCERNLASVLNEFAEILSKRIYIDIYMYVYITCIVIACLCIYIVYIYLGPTVQLPIEYFVAFT